MEQNKLYILYLSLCKQLIKFRSISQAAFNLLVDEQVIHNEHRFMKLIHNIKDGTVTIHFY